MPPAALPTDLPSLLERPAALLIEAGHTPGAALAMTANAARSVCESGESLTGVSISEATRSAFCGALGRWQQTRNRYRDLHKQMHRMRQLRMTPVEQEQLAESFEARVALVEGVLSGLDEPTPITFQLVEALGGDPDLDAARGRFERELGDLRALAEATRRGQPRASGPKPQKAMQLKKPALARPSLRKGDKGERVVHLQNRLNAVGADVQPDGVFGSKTHRAVKEFQTHATLKPDGQVGPRTTDALRSAPADAELESRHGGVPGGSPDAARSAAGPAGDAPPKPRPNDAEPGTAGEAGSMTVPDGSWLYRGLGVGEEPHAGVSGLQQKLSSAGFEAAVDGKFGPDTHRQVKRFQSAWGLRRDGMVGPKTQAALDDAGSAEKKLKEAVERRQAAQRAGDAREFTLWRSRELKLVEARAVNRQMCPTCGRGSSAHLSKCPRCGADLSESKLMVAGRKMLPHPEEVRGVLPTGPIVNRGGLDSLPTADVQEARDSSASDEHRNVKCPKCGTVQSATHKSCSKCGHSLEGARKAKFAKGDVEESMFEPAKHPRARGGKFAEEAGRVWRPSPELQRDPFVKERAMLTRNIGQSEIEAAAQRTLAHEPSAGYANRDEWKRVRGDARVARDGLPPSDPRAAAVQKKLAAIAKAEPLEEAEMQYVAQFTDAQLEECRRVGSRDFARDAFKLGTSADRLLLEAKDSLMKASTPEPFSTSKTSNWVARVGGLPPYIQHIAHALVNKRGKTESNAIQMAIGIVKRWAKGVGKVDANTRAAAAKAMAEWEAKRARSHGQGAVKHAAKAAT